MRRRRLNLFGLGERFGILARQAGEDSFELDPVQAHDVSHGLALIRPEGGVGIGIDYIRRTVPFVQADVEIGVFGEAQDVKCLAAKVDACWHNASSTRSKV
jgi:hypothetical protein